MEYTKTVWKDLPDTTTPITASRLNNIEDGVEYLFENGAGDTLPIGTEIDFDGQASSIPTGWEQTTDPESYSTSEVKTNKTWIDGKPIYRKVFTGSLVATEVNVDISSLESDFCYLEKGILVSNGGPIYVIPTAYDTVTSHTTFEINLSQNTCRLQNGSSESPYLRGTYYIVLEYTKTTDQGGNS